LITYFQPGAWQSQPKPSFQNFDTSKVEYQIAPSSRKKKNSNTHTNVAQQIIPPVIRIKDNLKKITKTKSIKELGVFT